MCLLLKTEWRDSVFTQVSLWETRLLDLDEYLLNLNTIQRRWVYLEPIFGRGALPREEARFKRVDEDFRCVVSTLHQIKSFCPKVHEYTGSFPFSYRYSRYLLIGFFCVSESLRWYLNEAIFVCYRSILSDIQRDNRIVSLSTRAGIRNALVTILDQLQRCQKSLNEFLEVHKRTSVSRRSPI